MRVLPFCLLLLAVSAVRPGAGDRPLTSAAGDALIERFLARQDEPLTSYSGTRCLAASNERFKATGSMQVAVTLTSERGLEWTVIHEEGSGYIRNKVLRKALEGEREMIAKGEPMRASLSPDNYEIALHAASDDASAGELGTVRLLLTPRRRDVLLVRGSVLITDPEADLLQVQGQLAKTPSWWTTRVDVVRTYGRIAGVRVPVELSSTAQVRIAGRSQFRMTSAFERVNGRPTGTAIPGGYCTTTTISFPAGPTPPGPMARTRT
jgi:hypothetical protein